MLLVYTALLVLASVLVSGGSLVALADVRLRGAWLVAVALGLQILIVSVFPASFDGLHRPAHLASYVLIAAFLWRNRRLPGLPLVATGAIANALAIFANGGVMPASPEALAAAGLSAEEAGEFANSAVVEDSSLAWLGDVFAVPASWPASNVFSIGDLLIAVGLTVGLHALSSSRVAVALAAARARARSTAV